MKVTFTYHPLEAATPLVPLVLSLGERLSPVGPVQFAHTGVAQASHPVRADQQKFYGRGGASTQETFLAQKEHDSHWDAMLWSRVALSGARGKNGTLLFEGDAGGKIKLVDCVMVEAVASPGLVGIVSFVRFGFVGGTWEPG